MYYFVGSCVGSFDEDAECTIPELPYRDTTEFAQAEESYITVSKKQFIDNVTIQHKDFEKLISKKSTEFLYDKDNDIFIMYDGKKDIHYFFISG